MTPVRNAADLVRWNGDQTKRVEGALERMLAGLVLENGQVLLPKWFSFDLDRYFLSSVVELSEISSQRLKRRLILEAVARCFREGQRGAEAFRAELGLAVQSLLEQAPRVLYVVFPLRARLDRTNVHPLRALGLELSITTWSQIGQRFRIDSWRDEVWPHCDHEKVLGFPMTPVVVKVEARSADQAYPNALAAFDLLRTTLNIREVYQKVVLQADSERPLGRVSPSPTFAVFNEDGTLATSYVDSISPRSDPIADFDRKALVDVQKTLDRFELPTDGKDVRGLLLEAVHRYGKALDDPDREQAFLALWQILELATFNPEDKFQISEVANRVAALLGQSEQVCGLLDALMKTRNTLVHRGRFSDDGLADVNALKFVVEETIDRIIELQQKCPTRQLLHKFLQYLRSSDHDLKVAGQAISLVQAGRATQSTGTKTVRNGKSTSGPTQG